MPPNHQTPIENVNLWDILDWDVVSGLAQEAAGDPRDEGGKNALPWTAKILIDSAAKDGNEDEEFFHKVVATFVTAGSDADRRQKAGQLALLFGARADRLIEFIAFKWGLFKRTGSSTR